MITSVFYLILSIFSAAIAFGFWSSYLRNNLKSGKIRNFAIFFALLSFYKLLLSYFLFFDDLYFAAWLYNLAIAMLYLMILFVSSIIFSVLKVNLERRNIYYYSIIIVGIIVVGLQIYDFNLPIIKQDGFIDWNANKISTAITSLSIFATSLAWTWALLTNVSFFHGHPRSGKGAMLAIGGLFLGLGGLTTNHTYDNTIAIISHTVTFTGCLLIFFSITILSDNKQ